MLGAERVVTKSHHLDGVVSGNPKELSFLSNKIERRRVMKRRIHQSRDSNCPGLEV